MRRVLLVILATASGSAMVVASDLADDLAKVRSAAAEQGVSDDAQQAWRRLAAIDASRLPELLAGMNGAGPLAENWLRAAVDAVAERTLKSGSELPTAELEAFVNDTAQAPRARRVAFEWLTQVDPDAKPRLLSAMVDDPSLSLRYDAIDQLLQKARMKQTAASQTEKYRTALKHVRNLEQLEQIAAELKKLDVEVDLPGVLGFLKTWQVIGPFDNTKMGHFDTAYPPEQEQLLAQPYDDKSGEVAWTPTTAKAEDGTVDLIEPLGKEKEAVGYAYATFQANASDASSTVEVRYESRNATKVWLNGELIASDEVYHSGGGFDQYRAEARLQPGENTVLVKLCQNEMAMPWEREWGFRLRVVDKLGAPVATQAAEGIDAPGAPQRR